VQELPAEINREIVSACRALPPGAPPRKIV
jgi:hypothetical protein